MKMKLRSRLSLLFLSFAMVVGLPAMALADQIGNNIDANIDADVEQTSVQVGGPAGSDTKQVGYLVQPQNEATDGDAGCNLDGSTEKLVVNVASDKPGVATVSPSQLSFSGPGCGDTPSVTVKGVSAGTATITLTQSSNNTGGTFNLTTATFQVTVTSAQKEVTGSFTAANKAYDGTTAATIASRSLSGVTAGDNVTLSGGTATFADKNAANGKTVTGTGFSLSGADAGKYKLASTTLTTTADITAKPITGSFTAANKTYDGNMSATVTDRSVNQADVVGTDAVSLTGGTATFADKNVGNGKTVTLDGASLTGANASNYSLTSVSTTTSNITAKQLTGSFTAGNKGYDGGTSATVASKSLPGVLPGDTVSLDVTNAQFGNKNAGTGKTVSADLALSGADANNYSLSSATGTATADITAKSVTGSFTAENKVYDGTNSATASNRTLNGAVNGDTVSLSGGTATFADGNVGPNKTVTLTGATLAGADAGNYSLASVGTTTAAITAKELTGSFTAENKVYDGTTDATIATSNLVGVVQGDDVGLSGDEASFANKNVGNGKTVTVNSGALSGTDASNYSLKAGPWTATADITAKSITGSFTAADKVYDGTTAATISGRALQGAIGGDLVSLSGGSATFDSKDVGTAKTVTGTGFGLSGTDAANYTLGSVSNTTASITAKSVTGSFTAADKVYDGNDSATVTGRTLPEAIAGDEVGLDGGTAKFSNKNVGTDKPVTLTGASLVGADKGNYTLGSVSNDQADITARDLAVSATGIDKVYDGNARATVNLSTNELSGDTVTAGYTGASFANKNVGTGKAVSVNGISISGADAANYNLTNATASTAADITARGLVVTATAANKVYDGNTDATATLSDNRVSGDVLSTSYASASFDNANAGTGKVVTVSGISVAGADSGNYTFNTSTTTSADIAKRAITVTADAKSKLFGDADPALTYQVSGGPLVSGDGFSGNLSRDPGEAPGQYSILQGSVSAGPNYAVNYVGAKLTIGAWTTKGFYAPVDMIDSTGKYIVNTVKGGSTVPMKFELFKGATELKDVSAVKSTTYSSSSYCGGAVSDEIEVVMTGSTSLRFDTTGDQFIYNWKTPTGAGCYKMTMTAQDGSQLIAYFKTR